MSARVALPCSGYSLAAPAIPAANDTPSLKIVLSRAGDYVVRFERELATLVAEEHYTQEVVGAEPIEHRELRSDLLFVTAGHTPLRRVSGCVRSGRSPCPWARRAVAASGEQPVRCLDGADRDRERTLQHRRHRANDQRPPAAADVSDPGESVAVQIQRPERRAASVDVEGYPVVVSPFHRLDRGLGDRVPEVERPTFIRFVDGRRETSPCMGASGSSPHPVVC